MSLAEDEDEQTAATTAGPLYTTTEEMLRDRLHKGNKGRYITQLYSCITVSVCAVCFGTALGWSSPMGRHFKVLNISRDKHSAITSMLPLGCSVGVTAWSFAIENFGPRRTMILQSPFSILSWVFMSTFNRPGTFLVSRFVCGFLAISYLLCGERLLIDSVHNTNLRHMFAIFRSSILLGVLITYSFDQQMNQQLGYRYAFIATLALILLFFIPESPVYLYKSSEDKALKSLEWYRGVGNAEGPLRQIRKDAEIRLLDVGRESYMLYQKVVWKAVLIIIGLTFFQVFSGYYGFLFYNYQIWADFRYNLEPKTDSAIVGVTMYVLCLISNYVHFNLPYGVRKPTLISLFFTTMQLLLMMVYQFFKHKGLVYCSENWIMRVILHLFIVAYECGLSTMATALFYEYLPYQVYRQVRIIMGVCLWFFTFLLTNFIFHLRDESDYHFIFVILASTTFAGFVLSCLFIVESKNKSLMEIQVQLGGNPVGTRSTLYGRGYRRQ